MPKGPLVAATAALAATLGLSAPANAQAFLTRAEVEAFMRDAVFCYHPDDRFACAWAELYSEFHEDHVILQSATAMWDAPMQVMEFRIDWVGDALCIPYDDQGLRVVRQADGYRFAFDMGGLTETSGEEIPELIESYRADAPQDFCFRYTIDDAGPDALFQHVFRDGVVDEALDPIALIPIFASGVAINPSG